MEKLISKVIMKIQQDKIKMAKQYLKNNRPIKIVKELTELLNKEC